MKIGDRVRFLSDVGGGIVRGFQGKNIVLVEDEDGFQIPTPIHDVIVVTTNDYNFEVQPESKPAEKAAAPAPPQPQPAEEEEEMEVEERDGGDRISLYLDFVPVNIKELSKTSFECYLVNDCNYYLSFAYMNKENGSAHLRQQGTIEPNTKLRLERLEYADLNDMERLTIAFVPFKRDKAFAPKQPMSIDIRLDLTKFYKLHTFRPSIFFDEQVMELPLVVDDQPIRPLSFSAQQLQNAMQEKGDAAPKTPKKQPARKLDPHATIEVDLHAHELLDTTAGMQPIDIKEYQLKKFRETMDAHLKEKGRRLVFIHGKGDGVLRKAILDELKRKYPRCEAQDASFQQYGFGATLVIVH